MTGDRKKTVDKKKLIDTNLRKQEKKWIMENEKTEIKKKVRSSKYKIRRQMRKEPRKAPKKT